MLKEDLHQVEAQFAEGQRFATMKKKALRESSIAHSVCVGMAGAEKAHFFKLLCGVVPNSLGQFFLAHHVATSLRKLRQGVTPRASVRFDNRGQLRRRLLHFSDFLCAGQ